MDMEYKLLMNSSDETAYEAKDNARLGDLEFYYPLLMVKDFNSKDFSVNNDFMTNADVPSIAMESVVENPINPFTGNAISSDEKTAHDQYIIASRTFKLKDNQGNTFTTNRWYSVKNNIWDISNWKLIENIETAIND